MAEAGFTYEVNLDNGPTAWSPLLEIDERVGTRDFAQTYGFGFSTNPWGEVFVADWEPPLDPNAAILAEMTAAQRQAWNDALWGPMPGEGHNFETWDWDDGGCNGRAQAQAMGIMTPEQVELRDELAHFTTVVREDPRVQAAHQGYYACMAEAGFPGLAPPIWSIGSNIDRQWDTARSRGEAAIAEFREMEIRMAVADYDCRVAVDLYGVTYKVDREVQAEFIARLGPELEAWAQQEEAQRARFLP
jgi:hypothetical protein